MLDENKDSLKTVTESGQPVKERISSVKAARELYKKFKEADFDAALLRARWKGMVDGNPPYNQTELDELGLGCITNVNFLEARAILDQKAGASFELLFEVPTLIEAKQVKWLDPQQPAADWGGVIAEEFTKLLFDWTGFTVNVDKARREADQNGIGVMIWRDEWDWRPKAFSRGCYLPEPMSELDLETHNLFYLRDSVSAGQLYKWAVEDEEAAEKGGWDPKAVRDLLVRVYVDEAQTNSTDRAQTSEWESLQQKIRLGDWTTEIKEIEKVRIAHMLVREIDTGEVSHYVFPEDEIPGDETPGKVGTPETFLFKKLRRFKSMAQVLWLLPYNYGDGYLKSVRGLAGMIESHCDLSNRYLGRVFDAGFTSASLLLQPDGAMDMSKLQLIRMGIMTIIPPGLQAVQSTFQPQIAPMVQLRDLSISIMRNNTGVWRQHPELFAESGPQKTARQVVEEAGKEARMEKINVAFEYNQMQLLYREMFRRATNLDYLSSAVDRPGRDEARKFVSRCVLRGVPIEVLTDPEAWDIYATQAIGQGSWGVKMDITNQILGIRGLLDEPGQRNALRDWLAVRAGQRNVDRYASLINRDKIPTNETSFASMENNDMAEGSPVVVGSDQTHAIHLYQHLDPISQVIQAVLETKGEGLDMQKAMNILRQGLPHAEQHMQYLAADPKRKALVDEVAKVIKSGVEVYKFLEKRAEAAAKMQQQQDAANQQVVAEAQQQLGSGDLQLKAKKLELDYMLDLKKQEATAALRSQKTAELLAMRKAEQDQRLAMDAERMARELEIKARSVDAEIEQKRAKSAAT